MPGVPGVRVPSTEGADAPHVRAHLRGHLRAHLRGHLRGHLTRARHFPRFRRVRLVVVAQW